VAIVTSPRCGSILVLFAVACGSGSNAEGTSFATMGTTGDEPTTSATSSTSPTSSSPTTTSVADTSSSGSSDDGFPGTPDLPPQDTDTGDPPNAIPETCDEALEAASSMGCEFFAVELENFGQGGSYAIVAANVQTDTMADVVVETYDGAVWTPVVPAEQIAPMDAFVFVVGGTEIAGSGIATSAYRVTSSVPIAAYQFNSYSAIATSDASLLLPVSAWDTLHRVASLERVDNDPFVWTSYFAVIAAQPDTSLEIVATDDWLAGMGVPAALDGETVMLDLDEADVAQIAMSTDGPRDPTGTRIDSGDVPVAVFGGTSCSIILDQETFGACDHLEEQLPGVRLWGQSFVAARAPVRSMSANAEASLWQVVASEDATTVTFAADAAVIGIPAGPVMLDAGEQVRFLVRGPAEQPGDFSVEADHPILLVNYTLSGDELFDEFGNGSPGDPAMILLPPVEQYLPRYVVLVPAGWDQDVLTIVRPNGAGVTVDGVPVGDEVFYAVGATHEVGRVVVADGLHRIEAGVGVAITVAGYRSDDSYGYAGGLGTGVINPRPEG
jgi:hypothetical protein